MSGVVFLACALLTSGQVIGDGRGGTTGTLSASRGSMGGGRLLSPHFVILDRRSSSGWGSGGSFHYVVSLLGQSLDELRLLKEVGDALSKHPA